VKICPTVFTIIFTFISTGILLAQDTIYLKNSSFEDKPRRGEQFSQPITGWTDCGQINFSEVSPPDIHPTLDSAWQVNMSAQDGLTYIGLVTRYDGTYESVSQHLSKPLKAGKCYKLSGYFALSETYKSATPRSSNPVIITKGKKKKEVSWSYWLTHDDEKMNITQKPAELENFAQPVELLLWGGYADCKRNQLYVHSGPVKDHTWTPFTLEFSPIGNHDYITLGAFYIYNYSAPYNGHLLLDGLSPIIEISCD